MLKRLKPYRNNILYVAVVITAVLLLIIGHKVTTEGKEIFGKFAGARVEPAVVQEVLFEERKDYDIGYETQVYFKAKMTSGENKNEVLTVRQFLDSFYTVPIKPVEQGDKVMISYVPYGGQEIWVFQEYNRSGPILVLLCAFVVMLMVFGGKKGVATIISLALTFGCVFYYFVPAILSGQNIYLSTIMVCLYVITVTLVLVNGFNFKSLAAGAGCLGGLLVAGILFFISNNFLSLTGMLDEDSAYLTMMGIPFDLVALIFSGILIGVLGGVLDVGVSIGASLSEIYPEGENHEFRDIIRSGMNIGRDILCTMTNTLVLVYMGGALSLTLLLTVYSNSFLELINRETILVEILSALLGSMGLLFTIPLTTFFYAFWTTRKPAHKDELILPDPEPLVTRELPEEFKDN